MSILTAERVFQGKMFPEQTGDYVQTRSEETGLIQHKTLNDAIQLAIQDRTVWKISYQSGNGQVRRTVNDSF